MRLSQWGHRFVVWGNGNLLTVTIIFDLLIVGTGMWAFRVANSNDVERHREDDLRRQTVVAEASVQTCKSVVVTLTDQSKADDLATIVALRDALDGNNRAIEAALLEAENKILQRQAPTGACEPKENP